MEKLTITNTTGQELKVPVFNSGVNVKLEDGDELILTSKSSEDTSFMKNVAKDLDIKINTTESLNTDTDNNDNNNENAEDEEDVTSANILYNALIESEYTSYDSQGYGWSFDFTLKNPVSVTFNMKFKPTITIEDENEIISSPRVYISISGVGDGTPSYNITNNKLVSINYGTGNAEESMDLVLYDGYPGTRLDEPYWTTSYDGMDVTELDTEEAFNTRLAELNSFEHENEGKYARFSGLMHNLDLTNEEDLAALKSACERLVKLGIKIENK